jgi:hypothetical protein
MRSFFLLLLLVTRCGAPDATPDAILEDATSLDALADALDEGLHVGARLPSWRLQRCDGQAIELAALSDGAGATWITVHAGWCLSCRAQHEGLERLHQRFAARGLRIVLVLGEGGVPESGEVGGDYCAAFADELALPFPVLRDEGFSESGALVDRALPFQIILDGDGVIRRLDPGWDRSFQEDLYAESFEALLLE